MATTQNPFQLVFCDGTALVDLLLHHYVLSCGALSWWLVHYWLQPTLIVFSMEKWMILEEVVYDLLW